MAGAATRGGNCRGGGSDEIRALDRGDRAFRQGERLHRDRGGPGVGVPVRGYASAVILQPGYAADRAAVLDHPVRFAGRVLDNGPLIPEMSGSSDIIADIAVAAAGAGVGSEAAFGACRGGDHADVVVPQGIDVISVIGEAAVRADIVRVAHFQAGGQDHGAPKAVSIGLGQDSAADCAKLGIGAGCRRAGCVASGRNRLPDRMAAGDAGVFHHAVMVAGGRGQRPAIVHAVAGGGEIVVDKALAANRADVQDMSPCGAGGRGGIGNEAVPGGLGDVFNVPFPADLAFPDGVAGGGAGGSDVIGSVVVLALRGDRLLHIAAVAANIEDLAFRFAVSGADDNALVGMADGAHIVALLHQTAVDADVALIAKLGAGGEDGFDQGEIVRIPAGTAAVPGASGMAAIAVRSAAAAGTAAVLIPQPDVGRAILDHVGAPIGVGDLVKNHILPFFGKVGRGGQGAVLRRVTVADGRGHAGFGEVGDGNGMPFAVHDAVIVGDHALCRHERIVDILARDTVLDEGEALVAELGDGLQLRGVALQRHAFRGPCAEAEHAIGTAADRPAVVVVVRVLISHGFVQIVNKFSRAVVELVHVF